MAVVRFTSPFISYCGAASIRMHADTLGELCRDLIRRCGRMDVILDPQGDISRRIVVLVDRRNAHTLSGAATVLEEDTEVLIMPVMGGG